MTDDGSGGGPGRGLSLDRIVRAAIAVADAEGLEGLTMRRIAADLGAGTMSLYRYVPGKDELVGHMVDAVFGELRYPDPPPQGWRAKLEWAGRQEWAMYRRHGWVLPVVATQRPVVRPNVLAYLERVLAAVDHLGLDGDTMMQVFLVVSDYAQGTALYDIDEAAARRRTGLSLEEWWAKRLHELRPMLESGRFPVWSKLISAEGVSSGTGKSFEFGLQRVLDGLEVFLEQRRPANSEADPGTWLSEVTQVPEVTARAMETLGRRWVLEILYVLSRRESRFADLALAIPGVSRRLLTERLRRLVAEGLVYRTVRPGPPTRITYALTEQGAGLRTALDAIDAWARERQAATGAERP